MNEEIKTEEVVVESPEVVETQPIEEPKEEVVEAVEEATEPTPEVVEEPSEESKTVEPSPEIVSSEEGLPVDVSFDDAQIAAILGAGLEPGQVRNELGLVKKLGLPPITLTEAVSRASFKYIKKVEV